MPTAKIMQSTLWGIFIYENILYNENCIKHKKENNILIRLDIKIK